MEGERWGRGYGNCSFNNSVMPGVSLEVGLGASLTKALIPVTFKSVGPFEKIASFNDIFNEIYLYSEMYASCQLFCSF